MNHPIHPTPTPPRWGRFTAWTTAAAITAFALGGGLGILLTNDQDEPLANPAACKEALWDNLRKTAAAGPNAPTAPAPPACLGLDRATLEQVTREVITEYWDSPEAEKVVEDALRSAAAQP